MFSLIHVGRIILRTVIDPSIILSSSIVNDMQPSGEGSAILITNGIGTDGTD
jgi:hypothetical protein